MTSSYLCIVCDAPASQGTCEKCGSKTFQEDDPDLKLMLAEGNAAAAYSRDSRNSMILSFVVGLPLFGVGTWLSGTWIGGVIIAAGAVFGMTKLLARNKS